MNQEQHSNPPSPRVSDLESIAARVFGLELGTVHYELGPEDVLTWDSLGQLDLIVALEKHYGLRFEIEEIFEIFTLGDIARILAAKGFEP